MYDTQTHYTHHTLHLANQAKESSMMVKNSRDVSVPQLQLQPATTMNTLLVNIKQIQLKIVVILSKQYARWFLQEVYGRRRMLNKFGSKFVNRKWTSGL